MKKSYLYIAMLLASTQVVLFQNCAKVNFAGADSNVSVTGTQTCSTTLVQEDGIVKILFMIDISGSNQNPGTDINKVWRSAVINKFLQNYANKPNFYYNISIFHNDLSKSLTNDSSGQPVFSNDASMIQQSLTAFQSIPDTDDTPYKQALQVSSEVIADDLAINNSSDPLLKPHYSVVFLSDGAPDGYSGIGNNLGKPGQDPVAGLAALTQDVSSVISLASDQISLNTVYYYNHQEDANAESLLQSMASTGNGSFLIANSGSVPQVDDSISIPHTDCVANN